MNQLSPQPSMGRSPPKPPVVVGVDMVDPDNDHIARTIMTFSAPTQFIIKTLGAFIVHPSS